MSKKRKTEAQLEAEEATIRDNLGFTDAMNADPDGVRRLAYRLEHEFTSLEFFSRLPQPVKARIGTVGRDIRMLRDFMDGFIAAGGGK